MALFGPRPQTTPQPGRDQAKGQAASFAASFRPQSRDSAFRLVLERHCVELQTMVDQPITEAPRDVGLEAFDVFGLKFDHFARAEIDEVVVMAVGHLLVARAAVAEIMPLDDA